MKTLHFFLPLLIPYSFNHWPHPEPFPIMETILEDKKELSGEKKKNHEASIINFQFNSHFEVTDKILLFFNRGNGSF